MVVRACISEFDVCAGGTDAGAEFTPWRNITAEEVGAVGTTSSRTVNPDSRRSSTAGSGPPRTSSPPSSRRWRRQPHRRGARVRIDLYSPEAEEAFAPAS